MSLRYFWSSSRFWRSAGTRSRHERPNGSRWITRYSIRPKWSSFRHPNSPIYTISCSTRIRGAVADYAAGTRAAHSRRLHRLVCPAPPPTLGELAADCVRELERIRAPLSDADRQRRLQARLTPRQIANVEAWGYPYVFEDYVFHMTLTGKLPVEKTEAALSRIAQAWQPLAGPVCVDAITILEQPQRDLSFRVIERLPLSGT